MLEEGKMTYDYKCSVEGSPAQRCQTSANSYTLSPPPFLSKSFKWSLLGMILTSGKQAHFEFAFILRPACLSFVRTERGK